MAFRLLSVLAAVFVVAGIALFFLHAFSYLIALALAVVFAIGALVARGLRRSGATQVQG